MYNKLALVTGAGRGIGLETSRLLIEHGFKTIVVDNNEENLNDAVKDLNNDLCIPYLCDVSNEESVKALCEEVLNKYGTVTVLVNNAGIFRPDRGLFKDSKSEHWKKKIDINIYGTLYFIRFLINPMIEQHEGRIVNLSSVTAKYGAMNMADYTLTKGAIKSFSISLSKEVAEYNVRVNTVSPGNIEPDNRYPNMSYMNRSGSYKECAQLIYFLCSDEASFITGEDYVVDGGRRKI